MVRKKNKFDQLIQLTTVQQAHQSKNTIAQEQEEEQEGKKEISTSTVSSSTVAENVVVEIDSSSGGGGGTAFVPTEEWLLSWKSKLPLNVIIRLLVHLQPRVEALSLSLNGCIVEQDIITFIQDTTLVGVLPQPHPIVVRKYQPNKYTSLWFTTFLWGVVFMRNQSVPLWDGSTIQIFTLMNEP